MSIFFNFDAQRRLLDAYSRAQALIDDTTPVLNALVTQTDELLDTRNASARIDELEAISRQLKRDRIDLSERSAFLQTADARTAFILSTTTGRLINPNLARKAIDSGWTYDEALARQRIELLSSQARPFTAAHHAELAATATTLAAIERPATVGQTRGDPDSDLGRPSVGQPLRISSTNPQERGRDLLVRSLADTANPDQILGDEFEAFFHDNGKLTIVLPGVIDLSTPQLGYDPDNASLRDLDQEAVPSFFTSNVSDNGYAHRVREWAELMVSTGVLQAGTPTAIIGHSFGGDTAFDLAADTQFNGEVLTVTHVFSAGYNSGAGFDNIPEHTRALAARNMFDAVTLTEIALRQGPGAPRNRLTMELVEAAANADHYILATALQAADASDDRTEEAQASRNPIPRIELAGDRVQEMEPNGLNITFEGNFDLEGFGHHPTTYTSYLENTEAPGVLDYFVELDAQGFTDNAVAVSIDISHD